MERSQTDPLLSVEPTASSVVFASAGTGKTWLLVARLLRLLLSGVAPNAIVAVTFTQKAAFEIYERLMQHAKDWARMRDDDLRDALKQIGAGAEQLEAARRLYRKLTNEEPVRISTFHSLCSSIIRLFPFDDKLPFDFTISDDIRSEQFFDDALNALYVEATRDENLAENLNQLVAQCNDKLPNAAKTLKEFLHHRNTWRLLDRDVGEAKRRLAEALKLDADESTALLDESMRALVAEWVALIGAQKSPLSRDKQALEFLRSNWPEDIEDFTPSADWLKQFSACFVTAKGTTRHDETQAFVTRMRGDGDKARRVIEIERSIANCIAASEEARLKRAAWARNAAWYACGDRFFALYENLQHHAKTLDFDDLEWHALRLLKQKEHRMTVRVSLRVEHILVDEFQDTNPEQWRLLLFFLEEIAAQEAGSAFIVGDAKQAIYGFRRTNAKLLHQAGDWICERLNGRAFHLNTSRRSSDAVIAFVNRVFQSRDDTLRLSKITDFEPHATYRKEIGEVGVLPLATPAPPTSPTPPTLPASPKDDQPSDASWTSPLRRQATSVVSVIDIEARQIATTILRLREEHSYLWRDFMVLARRKKSLAAYQAALRKYDIPFSGKHATLSESLEARDILTLLRFLISPRGLLALCQILRSPLFAIRDDDLRALTGAPGDAPMDKLRHLSENADDAVWRDAWNLLTQWMAQAKTLPPHDLLHRIYSQRDAILRYRRVNDADKRNLSESRLKDLLRLALDFRGGRYPDTVEFIHYLEHLPPDYRLALSQDDDGDKVQLLTIHGAKGLEAKVVMLCACGALRAKTDNYSTLVDWPEDAERPRHMVITASSKDVDSFSEAIGAQSKERLELDRVNLLYVALTRARERLFVSGHEVRGSQEDWFACLSRHAPTIAAPDCERLAEKDGSAREPNELAEPIVRADAPYRSEGDLEEEAKAAREASTAPSRAYATGKAANAVASRAAANRGIAIHKALQWLCEGRSTDSIKAHLAHAMRVDEDTASQWLQSAEKVWNNSKFKDIFDESLYVKSYNEMPLDFVHGGRRVSGRIDRVCVSENSVHLIDYKTHAEVKHALQSGVEQMNLYAAGAALIWPRRTIKKTLLCTETAERIEC